MMNKIWVEVASIKGATNNNGVLGYRKQELVFPILIFKKLLLNFI